MSETQYNLTQDLYVIRAMIDALEDYVHGQTLYYNISSALPQLTLGSFLLRLRRLQLFQDNLTSQQILALHDTINKHRDIATKWQYHYDQKMEEEARSRLMVIRFYIAECVEEPNQCEENYPVEALRRTFVQELLIAMRRSQVKQLDDIETHAAVVDRGLDQILQRSDFLWDAALKPAYPKSDFWWLYRVPQLPIVKVVEMDTNEIPME